MKVNKLGTVAPIAKQQNKKKKGKQVSVRALYSAKAKGLLFVVALVQLSACTSGSGISWHGSDYFKLEGTPEGIAAFDEYQNGLVTNGKMQDPTTSPHWTVKKTRIDYKILLEQKRKAR